MRLSCFKFLILLGLLIQPVGSAPQQLHCQADLLCAQRALVPGQPVRVAVRLRPQPGWHTYWSNPGESGLATDIKWQLPPGWKASPIRWPLPHRIVANGIVSYGYEGETYHEVTLEPPAQLSGPQVTLKAHVSWLACTAENCLPEETDVALTLAVADTSEKSEQAAGFDAQAWPQAAPSSWSCHRQGPTLILQGEWTGKAEFFPADGLMILDNAPQTSTPRGLQLTAATTTKPLQRLKGLLVTGEGNERKGYQIDLPILPR